MGDDYCTCDVLAMHKLAVYIPLVFSHTIPYMGKFWWGEIANLANSELFAKNFQYSQVQ